MAPGRLTEGPASRAFDLAAEVLDPDEDDRPLGEDLARAAELLPRLGSVLDYSSIGLRPPEQPATRRSASARRRS